MVCTAHQNVSCRPHMVNTSWLWHNNNVYIKKINFNENFCLKNCCAAFSSHLRHAAPARQMEIKGSHVCDHVVPKRSRQHHFCLQEAAQAKGQSGLSSICCVLLQFRFCYYPRLPLTLRRHPISRN